MKADCHHSNPQGPGRDNCIPEYIYSINNKEIADLKSKLFSLEETIKDFSQLQSNYHFASNKITNLNESIVHFRLRNQAITRKSNDEIVKLNQVNGALKARIKDQQTERRIIDEDRSNIQFHHDTAVNDKETYKMKIKQNEDGIDEVSKEISFLRAKLNGLKHSNDKDKQLIERNQRRTEDDCNSFNINGIHIHEMKKMNCTIKTQINEFEKENKRAKDEIANQERETNNEKEAIMRLSRKKDDALEKTMSKSADLKRITEEVNDRITELNEIKERISSLKRDIRIKENDILIKDNMIDTNKEHSSQLKENNKSLNCELFKLNNCIQIHKAKLGSLIHQNNTFSSELEKVLFSDTTEIKKQLSQSKDIEEAIFEIKSSMIIEKKQFEDSLRIASSFLLEG